MKIKEAKTGGLIKELVELEKYRSELIKELDRRYDKECNSAKKFIKKVIKVSNNVKDKR